MYKKYLLINQSNSIFVSNEEFDKLFDSLLISMPVKVKSEVYKLNIQS